MTAQVKWKRLGFFTRLLDPAGPAERYRLATEQIIHAEEFGFDVAKDHSAIGAWLGRIKALPGWGHPYDLMPGYPIQL